MTTSWGAAWPGPLSSSRLGFFPHSGLTSASRSAVLPIASPQTRALGCHIHPLIPGATLLRPPRPAPRTAGPHPCPRTDRSSAERPPGSAELLSALGSSGRTRQEQDPLCLRDSHAIETSFHLETLADGTHLVHFKDC